MKTTSPPLMNKLHYCFQTIFIIPLITFLLFSGDINFFQAKTTEEKKAVIQAWLDEIKASSDKKTHTTLQDEYLAGFKDQMFSKYFGKTYFDLSEKDKKNILSFLEKNFANNASIRNILTIPFGTNTNSLSYKNFVAKIIRINNRHVLTRKDLEKGEIRKTGVYKDRYIYKYDLPECVYIPSATKIYHNTCDLIFETESYDIFWSAYGRMGFTENQPCYRTPNGGLGANISLVFKNVDNDFSVALDANYKRIVENEIIKAIEITGCNGLPLERVFIAHYVKGAMIPASQDNVCFYIEERYPGNCERLSRNGEIPLSSVKIEIQNKKLIYSPVLSILGEESASINDIINYRINQGREAAKLLKLRREREEQEYLQSIMDLKRAFEGIGSIMAPVLNLADSVEELALDKSGVVYARDIRDLNRSSFTICNSGKKELRIASVIEWKPRLSNFHSYIQSEIIISGWAYLKTGECRTVRTGLANSAFLAIEEKSPSGEYEPAWFTTDGQLTTDNINQYTNRFLRTEGYFFCVDPAKDFKYSIKELDEAKKCNQAQKTHLFYYFIQHNGKTRCTYSLGGKN